PDWRRSPGGKAYAWIGAATALGARRTAIARPHPRCAAAPRTPADSAGRWTTSTRLPAWLRSLRHRARSPATASPHRCGAAPDLPQLPVRSSRLLCLALESVFGNFGGHAAHAEAAILQCIRGIAAKIIMYNSNKDV